jgi:peptidoglycan-associated lipoprotein
MRKFVLALASLALVVGCQSKKKTEETQPVEPQKTEVDATPMSFDAAGSDSGKIAGLATVNFEYDKSSLSGQAKKILSSNAEWMKSNTKYNIQIEGHSDSRGSIEYNLSLGERRAQSVKNYMVGLGIPTSRLTVISYGEEKPLMQGETEDAYGKNRRANFLPLAQ